MSKYCYKNGADRSASDRVATNCQFVKNTVFVKYNKVNHNKTKYAYIVIENSFNENQVCERKIHKSCK